MISNHPFDSQQKTRYNRIPKRRECHNQRFDCPRRLKLQRLTKYPTPETQSPHNTHPLRNSQNNPFYKLRCVPIMFHRCENQLNFFVQDPILNLFFEPAFYRDPTCLVSFSIDAFDRLHVRHVLSFFLRPESSFYQFQYQQAHCTGTKS